MRVKTPEPSSRMIFVDVKGVSLPCSRETRKDPRTGNLRGLPASESGPRNHRGAIPMPKTYLSKKEEFRVQFNQRSASKRRHS